MCASYGVALPRGRACQRVEPNGGNARLSHEWLAAYPEAAAWVMQGASYVYESFVSPTLKKAGEEARKIPALKKALDQIDAFTVRSPALSARDATVFRSRVEYSDVSHPRNPSSLGTAPNVCHNSK